MLAASELAIACSRIKAGQGIQQFKAYNSLYRWVQHEADQKNNKYRLEIFNVYGKGQTAAKKANYPVDPNKLKFKKTLKVSFKITFKK